MLRNLLCVLTLLSLGTPVLAQQRLVEEFVTVDEGLWRRIKTSEVADLEIRPLEVLGKPTGEVRFLNRYGLATVKEWQGPVTVEVELTSEETGGGIPYAENFQVKTRSTGTTKPDWNFELQDGVGARLDFGYGKISLDYTVEGKNQVLASRFVRFRDGKMQISKTEFESDGATAFPEGAGVNWYKLKLVDDGEWCFVSLNDMLLCGAPYDASKLPGKNVVLIDREPTAGKTMVTYVRKATIVEKKK